MKKTTLIAINALLLVLICASGFYLYGVAKDRRITDFIKEKQTQLYDQAKQEKKEGNIGRTHVSAYLPKDDQGKVIASVEEQVYQHLNSSLGRTKPSGNIDKLLFVSTSGMPTNISTVRRIEITYQPYQVSWFTIQPGGKKDSQAILLAADNQPFRLHHLFSDVEKGKSLLAARIKTDLEAKQVPAQQVEQDLQSFSQIDLNNLAFTYEGSQLNLILPEDQVGLSQVTVEVSSLFDVVNSQYLTETDLQAYEAYQTEKLRKVRENMIALTFDDGPNPATTPLILDILKKYNAKATFFILGQNIAGNEAILKRIVAEGHDVANHSWSHPNLVTLTPDQVKQEIDQTQVAIQVATGKTPTMVRPPYGSVNQAVMDAMKLPAIYWSVDSQDWESRNPKTILEVIKANVRPGSIILMHDIHQPTADSLESVLQCLQEKGYSFGTLTDLLGPTLNPQLVYYDRDTTRPAN